MPLPSASPIAPFVGTTTPPVRAAVPDRRGTHAPELVAPDTTRPATAVRCARCSTQTIATPTAEATFRATPTLASLKLAVSTRGRIA